MRTISLTLPESDAERLDEVASRTGTTTEEAAAAAIKAQLDSDAIARREIEAGLAELDAGEGVDLEVYEREMDAFMASLNQRRG